MWRAQLERRQQAARKAGRIGWIGKAGPGVVMTSTKKGSDTGAMMAFNVRWRAVEPAGVTTGA